MAKRKTPRQLDSEIAASLASRGEPSLAAIFADPEARRVFAGEMRHEIQKKQTAGVTAAERVARPFTVKRIELMKFETGDRRVRSIVGNYPTEAEAQTRADQVGGWVETRDGRLVYGRVEEP
jgi:hypothetical protein